MDVCKSDAVIVRSPESISKRKFSRIGTTGLVVMTPFIVVSCFSKAEEETMNFIFQRFDLERFMSEGMIFYQNNMNFMSMYSLKIKIIISPSYMWDNTGKGKKKLLIF